MKNFTNLVIGEFGGNMNMNASFTNNSLIQRLNGAFESITRQLNVTKLGNDTLLGLSELIDRVANITSGEQLKKLVNTQLDMVFKKIDVLSNVSKNGTTKIQEWIKAKTSILKGDVTGKMITKLKTLVIQQLQSLLNKTLPMLLGNRIRDRIKSELQRLIDMVTPFLNFPAIQQQFEAKLRTFAKMVIGKVPGQNPNIVDEQLNQLISPELQRMTNKLKQFLNGQLQNMIDEFLQKYSAEKLSELLMSKANEGLNMLEKLVNDSIGGLEEEAKKTITSKLDKFLQQVSAQLLNVEKLKKWVRDEANKLIDKVTKQLDLRNVKQWILGQLKNIIGIGGNILPSGINKVPGNLPSGNIQNPASAIKETIKNVLGGKIAHLLSMFQQDSKIDSKNKDMETFREKAKEKLMNFVKNQLFGLVKQYIGRFLKNIFPDLFQPVLGAIHDQLKATKEVKETIEKAMDGLLGGTFHKMLGNKTQKLVGEVLKMALDQSDNGSNLRKLVLGLIKILDD